MSGISDDESDIADALRTLILTAYADGSPVEGSWTVESVPDEIPDWTVTVTEADLDSDDASAEGDVDVNVRVD